MLALLASYGLNDMGVYSNFGNNILASIKLGLFATSVHAEWKEINNLTTIDKYMLQVDSFLLQLNIWPTLCHKVLMSESFASRWK